MHNFVLQELQYIYTLQIQWNAAVHIYLRCSHKMIDRSTDRHTAENLSIFKYMK